jgi:hypothetical protein
MFISRPCTRECCADARSLEVTDLERALQVAQHALQSCRSIARGLWPVTDELPRVVARSEVPHHAPRPCRDMRRLGVPAGRMKDINPNDDHSTLRCGVCAPSCND